MRIAAQTFFDAKQVGPLQDYIGFVGRALEDRDFKGVWLSEHVVSFPKYDPAYPYPYSDDGAAPALLSELGMIDPMITLATLAMVTTALRLGTGIAILPQRNPVYFAKMGADIDSISNGRFAAGVGLGWSGQEFAATNTPFERRGARADEYLDVVRALWRDDVASYEGKFYTLPECSILPKPTQRPHPPFFLGGESAVARRRVARHGQGWFAYRLTPEELSRPLEELRSALAEQGRTIEEIEIVVSPGDKRCDKEMLAQYADLGVSEVVVPCFGHDQDSFARAADAIFENYIKPAYHL